MNINRFSGLCTMDSIKENFLLNFGQIASVGCVMCVAYDLRMILSEFRMNIPPVNCPFTVYKKRYMDAMKW